jgi:hypothetical protein
MKIQIKAHTPKGWILVDELHNNDISKMALTGGARANSVGPMVFPLSPPQRVDAVRLEIAGHGWFGGGAERSFQVGTRQVWVSPPSGAPADRCLKPSLPNELPGLSGYLLARALSDPQRPSTLLTG